MIICLVKLLKEKHNNRLININNVAIKKIIYIKGERTDNL